MNGYWLKSGIYTLLQKSTAVLLGFGSFFFLVRMLEKQEFGIWSLFIAVTTFFETVRSGLIQNSLVKHLASSSTDSYNKIISSSFIISGTLTVTIIILNLALANKLSELWEAPQLLKMFYYYSIVYFFSLFLTQFQFIEQANLKFKGIFISSTIRQGVFFLCVILIYYTNTKINLVNLVYIQIAATIASVFAAFIFVKIHLKNFKFEHNKLWISKLFKFGKYVFGTSVSSVLFNSINQLMLGAMISASATAVFNIAIRITNLVEIPTASVSAIVFPQSAKINSTEGINSVKLLYEKSVGVILAILIPGLIIASLFSEFVVTIIAGEKYQESVPILHLTLLNCLLIPFGRQFGTILDSIGKPKLTFKVVLLSAIINIILNYLFIKAYGLIGAAYGTLLASLIGFIIAQIILKKQLGIRLANVFHQMIYFYSDLFKKFTELTSRK